MARVLLSVLLIAGVVACAQPEPPPPPPAPERVEAPALGIAIAALPSSFRVVANEGADLRLAPTDERDGEIAVAVTEPDRINLVQQVRDHETELSARPGGAYGGQNELRGPLGSAYYSRGQYDADDGSRLEEIRLFALHPLGDRGLVMTYTYPAAEDTKVRLEEFVVDLFGEIEQIQMVEEGGAESESP
ncbi:MAG: hypothetical protein AAGD38_09930 [Acidobacteriota bacterium]